MSKRVLITGAAGGIGQATCRYFESRGYTVLCHARKRGQAETMAVGSRIGVYGDLTEPQELTALAQQVEKSGPLDVLVHNAGVLSTSTRKGPAGLGIQAEVNVVAPYALTQALAQHMQSSGDDPAVVVVASKAANMHRGNSYLDLAEPDGSALFGHYSLSKSAANAVVVAMAEKWPDLRIYSTEPGFVKTKMTVANSSMPGLMAFLARFVSRSPESGAQRAFDFLFQAQAPSGSVVQGGRVIDSTGRNWVKAEHQAQLRELLSMAGHEV
ncbi:MAG: SDR family NAD(P)-dependent oxidoreductase [Ahrensia sp.]|nr:SDR family NAD(P)-dependent oxidoreductase [Ahrensia sp.]